MIVTQVNIYIKKMKKKIIVIIISNTALSLSMHCIALHYACMHEGIGETNGPDGHTEYDMILYTYYTKYI